MLGTTKDTFQKLDIWLKSFPDEQIDHYVREEGAENRLTHQARYGERFVLTLPFWLNPVGTLISYLMSGFIIIKTKSSFIIRYTTGALLSDCIQSI